MGAAASSLIDDLHTSAQMPDEVSVNRKLEALAAVQHLGFDPITGVQIIEQGGIQPLLRCYNAAHPIVPRGEWRGARYPRPAHAERQYLANAARHEVESSRQELMWGTDSVPGGVVTTVRTDQLA